MKQLIKHFLRNLPPFKQFLARMKHLEERMLAETDRIQKETDQIRKEIVTIRGQLQRQNREQEILQTQLRHQNTELDRLNQKLEQAQKENASLRQILEKQKTTIETYQSNNVKTLTGIRTDQKEFSNQVKRINLETRRINGRINETNRDAIYLYFKGLHPDAYKDALADWYYQRMGVYPDLENPKTFREKIQWLKLYDSTPIKTRLADKYLVRDWVAEKIGSEYLIPLLGVWDRFDQIDFDQMPNQFVLKANHGSGWNVTVRDKSNFDIADAKKKFDSWMKKNFAFMNGLELHYMNIPRKIVAEKFIDEMDQVYDYKFMCFDGKVKFLWVDVDRYTGHKRSLFTSDWKPMKERISFPNPDYDIQKPKHFDEMVKLATALSQGFSLVRVDLYNINGRIYFGEMTFTPGSGIEPVFPEQFEYEMGDWVRLPARTYYCESII